MRRIIIFAFAALFSTTLAGQIFNPVKWSFSYKQVSDHEFDLIFTATINDPWVIYSQYLEGDDGPVPTSFHYDPGDHFELVGKNQETGNKKEAFDKVFNMTLVKFYKKAVFTQRVKVNDLSKPLSGYLEFMTCDDERCLPPTEEEFTFELKAAPGKSTGAIDTPTQSGERTEVAEVEPAIKPSIPDVGGFLEQPTALVQTPGAIFTPVKWELKTENLGNGEYNLIFSADIQDDWAIYSQFIEGDGPLPTAFVYQQGDHFELLGKNAESGNRKEGYDNVFMMNVAKFTGQGIFTQKIKVNDPAVPLRGYLEYMACDDAKCLPADQVDFLVDFASDRTLIGQEAATDIGGPAPSTKSLFDFPTPGEPVGQCGDTAAAVDEQGKGYWSIIVLGFIGGLLALLTPCVFPMIPLTVSFFTKSSGNRRKGLTNASLYGFFILLVYLILSIPFHLMDSLNPDILNDISTNVWLNIAFFAIFIFFAFSFFGYYELTLPSSWTNKVSSAEGIGGTIGIFFMALTLALVSFSCTGPILGSLLAGALSSDGGAMQLTAGMGGFGLALALPFALFAAFPGWMNSLPKSGGWLNTVKVVLGFLELALALKFLSNADLVKKWQILKIEPFLALWIIIALGLGLYLFGKIKFPHDSPIKKLSAGRIFLGLASFAFAIYLATGFITDEKAGSYRPLKLLSGLAPPVCYSWLQPCDCPQNLNCFKDLESGLAYAKKVNKPIMIDFTGHACVNCRKMEEHVWPDPQVYKHLKEDYVLISLYVDEKIELPEEEQIVVEKATGGTRKLRNYGHKWAHFQTEYFETNAQPYYALLSPGGQLLIPPVGYTPDANEYSDFLKCGLESFRKITEEDAEGKLDPQLGILELNEK
jgi:thiol:disulfide interchange protein